VIGIPGDQSLLALKALYDEGVLLRKTSDKLLSCPNCEAFGVSVRALCPSCQKASLQFEDYLEHSTCGFTGPREKFKVLSADVLKCPKCGQESRDIKVRARVYKCLSCGGSFESFMMAIVCNICGKTFDLNAGKFLDLYEYSLNEESTILAKAMDAITRFSAVAQVLRENGFQVQMPGQVAGSSGIVHSCGILAKKSKAGKETVMLIDGAVTDSAVEASRIMDLTPKLLDVRPDLGVFLAIPRLDEKAAGLAKQLTLTVIEAANVIETSEKVRELLASKGMNA
ncbi:MAG TPA: hypothetical protein VEG61_08155, partial [Candidatus Dormibacteraeota bacterium]|nr:hypothetical protein [Candidatus Dormibacteraeota bacterium]